MDWGFRKFLGGFGGKSPEAAPRREMNAPENFEIHSREANTLEEEGTLVTPIHEIDLSYYQERVHREFVLTVPGASVAYRVKLIGWEKPPALRPVSAEDLRANRGTSVTDSDPEYVEEWMRDTEVKKVMSPRITFRLIERIERPADAAAA